MDCVHLESYLESLKSGKYQGTQDAAFCAFQMGILYERLLARMASTHLEKRYKGLEAAAKGGKARRKYRIQREDRREVQKINTEEYLDFARDARNGNHHIRLTALYEMVGKRLHVSMKDHRGPI